jgi:putative transposase
MKLTLPIQLRPEPDHTRRLQATVERFNQAANWLAGEAFARQCSNKLTLQKLFYKELRESFELSSQMAVRCIAQVCEAYQRDKTKRPKFRPHAAMPFDPRIMSFKGADRVSILTLQGRVEVPFLMGKTQAEKFTNAQGQADLVWRSDGKWFLLVTVEVPAQTKIPATQFLGVDLGVVNIAADGDGKLHSSEKIEAKRVQYATRRRRLGKATRGAKRSKRRHCHKAIARTRKKEARYRRDLNHQISKTLVAKAKDTGRGLGMENLKGIRDRTRFRKPQRAQVNGWSFWQLRSFVEYKAALAGVMFEPVSPRDSSRTCAECGHCAKANRQSQSEFACQACGHQAHADTNSARILGFRASAAVNRRRGSEQPSMASVA